MLLLQLIFIFLPVSAWADAISKDDFLFERYLTNDHVASVGINSESHLYSAREIENWGQTLTRHERVDTHLQNLAFRKTQKLGPFGYMLLSPLPGMGRVLRNNLSDQSLAEYFTDLHQDWSGGKYLFFNFRGQNVSSFGVKNFTHITEILYGGGPIFDRQKWFWNFNYRNGLRYSLGPNWFLEGFANLTLSNFVIKAGQMMSNLDVDGFTQKYGAAVQLSTLIEGRWVLSLQQGFDFFRHSIQSSVYSGDTHYTNVQVFENVTKINVQFLL